MPSTKVDQDIQANAVAALAHYYQHRDHTALSRIVLKMPNSNRRTALLEWIHRFSSLRWDKNKNSFIRQKNLQEKPQHLNASTASTTAIAEDDLDHGEGFGPGADKADNNSGRKAA